MTAIPTQSGQRRERHTDTSVNTGGAAAVEAGTQARMNAVMAVKGRRGVDRTQAVAKAALECFSQGGFRLTQISDVSERMGFSVGTIYRYVESKEALFHLAALEAVDAVLEGLALPVKVTGPSDTAAALRAMIATDRLWPVLHAAVRGPAPADPKGRGPGDRGRTL